jgi:hypothetical protein
MKSRSRGAIVAMTCTLTAAMIGFSFWLQGGSSALRQYLLHLLTSAYGTKLPKPIRQACPQLLAKADMRGPKIRFMTHL